MRPPGSATESTSTAVQLRNSANQDQKVGMAALTGAATAITIRGLFYLALALIECSNRQREEGRGVRCYEADTSGTEVFIGSICILAGTYLGMVATNNK